MASVVAFFSVRKADEPADADHPYGHAKVENLAAGIEGMLILVGAGVIVFESVRRLVDPPEVESLGVGIAVIGLLGGGQPRRVHLPVPAGAAHRVAGAGGRRRAPAHRRRHLGRRARGLVLVEVTGVELLDPITALVVAVAIVVAGVRILCAPRGCWWTRRCRPTSSTWCAQASRATTPPRSSGFHKLRARRAGSRRYVDLHVQFATAPLCGAPTRSRTSSSAHQRAPARRRRAHPPRAQEAAGPAAGCGLRAG